MRIEKDKNNLLTIFNENIPQTKEYTYHASGYTFSDFDKWIIVMHKKELKIINLKNLGDTMSVIYLAPRAEIKEAFDTEGFINGLCLFDGFDETTGKRYYFIPKFVEKDLGIVNKELQVFGIKAEIKKTDNGFFVTGELSPKWHTGKQLSFLFALVLLYGKLDIKNGELIAVKVHIPLFGQFLKYEELFDTMKKKLTQEGIFISTSVQKNNDGMIYQISCNDYEVLKNFAEYYKTIEKIKKIPKYDLALETKENIIDFIATNKEIPQDGKAEVVKQLKTGTIKLLTK